MSANYKVVIAEPAASDLDEIVAYHIDALHAAMAAKSLLNDFDGLVEELGQTPEIYLKVRNRDLAADGYRWAPLAKSYAVFFIVDEQTHVVTIDRVLYHPRRWQGMLRI